MILPHHHLLLLIATSLHLVTAQYPPSEYCFRACETALGSVQFNATNPQTGLTGCSPETCSCVSELATRSLYLCTRLFCSETERKEGIAAFNSTCLWQAHVEAPPFSIVDRYGEEDVAKLRRLRREDAFPITIPVVNEVLLPNDDFFKLAYDTLDAAYFETRIHIVYGVCMYVFWAVVILIGVTARFARYIASRQHEWQQIPSHDPGSDAPSSKGNNHIFSIPYKLLKQYIAVPATFGYTRSQNISWWATIPTRIQSITISAFVILNIVLCSASYHIFQDNLYWRDMSAQMWRYVADRTGIISTANLGLIWIFGIRNNTLMWLTGWDFATYNNFHRWVARVSTMQAVVHSVAYTYMIVEGKFIIVLTENSWLIFNTDGTSWSSMWELFDHYLHKKYFWNGVIATVFMCLICGFSIYGFRRKFYETFLLIHIFLSVGVLVTMWYHVEIFNGFYNWFLYPCIFIWLLDRILRLFRIVLFNPKFWSTKAIATYNPSSNIVRLTIPYSTSFINPRPGTFYYISSLNSFQFWESHPFTLSYSTPCSPSPSTFELQQTSYSSHGTISPPRSFPSHLDSSSSSSSSSQAPTSSTTSSTRSFESETLLKATIKSPSPPKSTPSAKLTFLIRPYSGFTSRLRHSAQQTLNPTHRIILDGPYGHTQPFHRFTNVLFVAGGAGIAVPLSYLDVLLRNEEARVESLKVVWAVREQGFLRECLNGDFRGSVGDERLVVSAFLTGKGEENEEEDDEHKGKGKAKARKGVIIQQGRPDITSEIDQVASEVGFEGDLAVIACGPRKMADDARRAVVRLLGRGYGRVEYFEESFNW